MSRLNVAQPNGRNAIFDTVTDEFVEFDADAREFAESIPWEDALWCAIGATMEITGGVQAAIDRGLVSREHCEKILQDLEADF